MPEYDGQAARFIDIQFHDRGSTVETASGGRSPTFNAFGIAKGGRHIVDSRPLQEEAKPSILVLLLDTVEEERARGKAAAAPVANTGLPGTDTPTSQPAHVPIATAAAVEPEEALSASRALIAAYGKNPEDVDWSDIQTALEHALLAFGLPQDYPEQAYVAKEEA